MSDPFAATPPTHPPTNGAPVRQTPVPPQYLGTKATGPAQNQGHPRTPSGPRPPQNPPPAFEAPAVPDATPQVRRTAAIVVTSLGALLLAAAATVFMVIAWDRLRLPGKVGVVGSASVGFLVAGHQLRHRLSGVAAVLTHLGAVLAPLVAGAGAVALNADRPTVAVGGGVVGIIVLQLFDRMESPILAAGRALAGAGVAVGVGVWLGISPALLLIVITAAAALANRWNESISTALLAASTPVATWGATFAEPGSLLPWIDELSAMDRWLTALVAAAAMIVVDAQAWQLLAPRLLTARGRWAATVAAAIFAINLTAFADTAFAHPDLILILVASSVLAGRVGERIWNRAIGLYLDTWTWAVTGLTWLYLLSFDTPLSLQQPELIASVLLLVSWLLTDILGPSLDDAPTVGDRLFHGSGGPMASLGLVLASVSTAIATSHALGSTVGLIAVGLLFALSRRAYRAELTMVALAAALTAAIGSPLLLPAVSVAVVAAATFIMVTDLGRGVAPKVLQPLQVISLSIAGVAVLLEVIVTEPSWHAIGLHLLAFACSGVVLSRLTHVPDLVLLPRLAMIGPVIVSVGDLRMAGTFAVATGAALVLDRVIHHVVESQAIGLGLLTTGSWILAADAGIDAPEVYIAMPCLILAKIGYDVLRRGGSSWLGLAPSVGVFTAVGIIERVDGGGGWHAVATGAVAIVAMVVGVDRRWAGPSLVGLLSLLAILGVETAAYVPEVPLWIWLAVGGAFLVGAGVSLERSADEEGTASLKTAWAAFR